MRTDGRSAQRQMSERLPALGGRMPAWLSSYALAVVTAALALVLQVWLRSFFVSTTLILLYPAIFLASWLGGWGPGFLCTALCALGADYFLFEPIHSFRLLDIGTAVRLCLFCLVGVFAALLNERALRATHREAAARGKLEALFQVAAVGIGEVDPMTGRFLQVNRKLTEITGYSPDELRTLTFLDLTYPEDRDPDALRYDQLVRGDVTSYEAEKRYVRKDGRTIWVSVNIGLLRDPSGQPIRSVGTIRDITERRRAADATREATARLEQEQRSLKQTEAQLREAVRSRDEFLSIASHELKTPLTSLKLQLQLLERRLRQEGMAAPADRLLHGLESSTTQVNRLSALVEDLLDVSRISAGRLEYRFERIDLVPLVTEVLERHRGQLENAGCAIELQVPGGPVLAWADRFRMDQVVANLLSNAAKYGAGKPVRVSVFATDARRCVAVQDRGIGIAPESQELIFQRFERAVSDRNITGLGLGLYISKQIVDAHGGAIRLESALGKGSTFTVELPVRQAPSP